MKFQNNLSREVKTVVTPAPLPNINIYDLRNKNKITQSV
jgi:hypothetical protein